MKKLLSVILSAALLLCTFALPLSANAADYIGAEKAKSIALENAGIKASMATVVKNRLDYENGVRVYDVEFYTDLADYEYEINATTGKIVDKDIDRYFSISLSTKKYTYNGKEKKPSVNLKWKNGRAISSSNYTVSYKSNTKPGKAKVVISFNNKAYTGKFTKSFTINPKKQTITSVKRSGAKLTIKWKKDSTVSGYQLQYSTRSDFSNAKTKTISGSSKTSTTITGVQQKKYYARIRAYKNSGNDRIYGAWCTKGTTNSDYIGESKAKSIALNHAGLKESQVSGMWVKLDTDDGVKVYEVEFYYGGYEYEYEINAKTGKILDWDKDRD